jgi:hypothetical protein
MKIKSILFTFIFMIQVTITVQADDYLLDPAPVYYQGTAHVETQYEKPVDPDVCKLYLKNLRFFAKQNAPMSCERPIAPQLQEQLRNVEWENLDPSKYPDLFQAMVTRTFPPQ